MSGTGNDETTNFIDTSSDEGREQLRRENMDARTNISDNVDAVGDDVRHQQQERREDRRDPETGETVRQSPGDSARDAIAKRFRRNDPVPFNGDINDPEMTMGDVAREHHEPEPGDSAVGSRQEERTEQRQQQPQKRKLIVRGQELELTDDEILARAAKVTAADSYLEEARTLLEEAKTVKAERNSQNQRRPAGQTDTQDNVQDDDRAQDTRHPEPSMREVVDAIQYGDPEEAANRLEDAIDKRADKKAEERQLKRLMDNDLTKSQKALKDFVAANPDLDKDKMAARAIEATLYDIYEEDIIKLGLADPDQIPKDPAGKANWHRFYRVHGHPVRTAAEALEEAKTRVMRWRGTQNNGQQNNQQQTNKSSPRVNVDRTERRAAIPNSPQRSVSPPQPQQQQTTSRSSVIANMRRARGQIAV